MFKRISLLATTVCIAASLGFGQTSYIFQVAGPNSSSTVITGMGDNNFFSRNISSFGAGAGAFQVLALPDGSRFYIVSPAGIQSASPDLKTITAISGTNGTVTNAGMTPDGNYLVVLTVFADQSGHLYIIRTSTNTVVQTDAGLLGGSAVDFAVSPDSQTVWVLASNNSNGGTVAAVSLASFQTSQQVANLGFPPNSLSLSPLGLLYVTGTNTSLVNEIDPATLTVTPAGAMSVNGAPRKLRFTPDGTAAFAVNQGSCVQGGQVCYYLFKLNVATHSFSQAAPDGNNQPALFDDVFVASSGQAYLFSSTASPSTAKLWDVSSSPLAAVPSALGNKNPGPGLTIFNIYSVAISNEKPVPRYLYLLTQSSSQNFVRVNIADGSVDQSSSGDLSRGLGLSYASIPAQNSGSAAFGLNTIQTVTAGGTSAPLIAYVTDPVGRPVFRQQVCFATASGGPTIAAPSQFTNADGRVQTTVTAPTATGVYTVTISLCGSASNFATFTINVGTGTGNGGGNGGGPSQMSIFTGNGELLRQFNSTLNQPLTVKLTNTDGTPIVGAAVQFTVTSGPGTVDPATATSATDENGLASTIFDSNAVNQGQAFSPTVVNAASNFGSVNFIETTDNSDVVDPLGQPRILVTIPSANPVDGSITIAQGQVIPAAVIARTISGKAPQAGVPIPNIGIRIADDSTTLGQSSIVSCQGNTLGDAQGVSHCDLVAACQPAGTFLPLQKNVFAEVGEASSTQLLVTVTQGGGTVIQIVSGNNQTGNPSSTFTLLAKITDSCGLPAGGVNVNWSVTSPQGSAFLSSVQNSSANDGSVSARVTLGNTAGAVQVTVTPAGGSPVAFQLTTTIAVSGISLVSGGGQVAVIGQPFVNPVIFAVSDTNGRPVSGQTVSFSASNGASVNPTSATTNAQGQVQASVTAGSATGAIVVTATLGNFSTAANLTANLPGPVLTTTSFTNAASGAVGLTPCGLVTATGNGLDPIPGVVSGINAFGPLGYTLAGVSITVNNIPTPLQAVANVNGVQTVNFQAPCELAAGTATIVVTVNGVGATVNGVPVLAVQPGIFTYAGPNNKSYGAVIRAVDGSYVTPSNPARRGELLYMVATGLGQATPTLITNAAGTGSQNVNLPIFVGVSDHGITPISARYLVGYIGAYLIQFMIAPDAPTGTDQSLALAAQLPDGTLKFGNPVFLPGVI